MWDQKLPPDSRNSDLMSKQGLGTGLSELQCTWATPARCALMSVSLLRACNTEHVPRQYHRNYTPSMQARVSLPSTRAPMHIRHSRGLSHNARPHSLGGQAKTIHCIQTRPRLSRPTVRSGAAPGARASKSAGGPAAARASARSTPASRERDANTLLRARSPARLGCGMSDGSRQGNPAQAHKPCATGCARAARVAPLPLLLQPARPGQGAMPARKASGEPKRGQAGAAANFEHETRAGQKKQARDPETDHPSSHVASPGRPWLSTPPTSLPPRLQLPHQTRPDVPHQCRILVR